MATYKTPGVYVQEIPTLGSSVAGVPTAITGFAGYTEKATLLDGTPVPMIPVRITSLLEYQQIFGGPYSEKFKVTLTGTVPTPTTIATIPQSNSTALSNFILFYQVQMFYANGGGTCYITSVGNYSSFPTQAAMTTALTNGVDTFEQIDEITLLCTPEAVFLNSAGQRATIYNRMAAQCAKMQDRFAIADTIHIDGNTIFEDATNFRDNDISADNLKYAGAYYPALQTPTVYAYDDANVTILDNRTPGAAPYNYTYAAPNNTLLSVLNGTAGSADITVADTPSPFDATDKFGLATVLTPSPDTVTFVPSDLPLPLNDPTAYYWGTNTAESIKNLVAAINNHPTISEKFHATVLSATTPLKFRVEAKQVGTIGNTYYYVTPSGNTRFGAAGASIALSNGVGADKALYNNISDQLAKYTLVLYPSAAMAGIYANVDASRGVWKAPANVGLALVSAPSIQITDEDQENLNVDSVSGKSINAIRTFSGRGTLVWGARTLAGNDNEWRYINVRRLFIYVEESIKKATEFVVFEPNTAVTWQRVKAMSEAFLTSVWRDGGLAGATTKDAFFVNVGLGITMTAQDILEGRMIVQIGMAAVRPAEFIILQFEHKLQES